MAAEGPYADHNPWQIQSCRPGLKGLTLPAGNNPDAATVDQLLRMTNLEQRWPNPLSVRSGQAVLATIAANIHSGGSCADPSVPTVARVWGAGTSAYLQGVGAIQSGLSGRPLTYVGFYTEISDDPWLVVADGNTMFKVRVRDGLTLPVGLAAPAAPTAVISDLLTTRFAAFDSSDGTQASNWTATAGIDTGATPGSPGAPTIADITGVSGSAIELSTDKGSATAGYSSIGGVPIAVNASILQGGVADASDDDLVHIWVRVDRPEFVSEVRVYLVCSVGFDPSIVPGTSVDTNQDAYVKSFRPNDWTSFIEQQQAATETAQTIRDNTLTEQFQQDVTPEDQRALQPGDVAAATQVSRQTSVEVVGGRNVWSELGIVGVPLRRGDWARLGTEEDRDWATLTGLVVVVITNDTEDVVVALDDFFLTGGFGPDTSDPGAQGYTYYATDYDPRTGAESNGTVMSTTPAVNPARQRVTVQPQAAADGALRQRIYRTGGTITASINFIGESATNGGQVIDTVSDTTAVASPEMPEDHFQPIPGTNDDGTTALHSPVPTIFGPLGDMVFACGNVLSPGVMAACLPGEIDHWPDDLLIPVCPSSEELMNGVVGWGGSGWIFSREQLYSIYVNQVADGGPAITTQPTGCKPGLAARKGVCVTPRGIAYVASDAVRLTQGGPSSILTNDISAIFEGQSVEDTPAINFAVPDAIDLAFFNERLWFTYQGADGSRVTLRYDFIGQQWDGPQRFADPARCFVAEAATSTAAAQLLMGCASGAVNRLGGTTDNGTAIAYDMKSGAWDMGQPAVTKVMGDIQPEMNIPDGAPIALYAGINNDIYTDTAQTITGLAGRRRYQFNPFGTTPQRARNLTVRIAGSVSAAAQIHQVHASFLPEPLTTTSRPTPWESFPPGQGYVVGCAITADTGGENVPVLVEMDTAVANAGAPVATVAQLTCRHNGRQKIFYSWPAAVGSQIRLRPSTACGVWILYDVHWLYAPEPGRLAAWDSDVETFSDTYYTGLDLEVNTYGQQKTIVVSVDGVDLPAQTITTSARSVVHLSIGPGYGHSYKFRATDANPGSLYGHAWRLEEAPGEQSNWNQPITAMGTNATKYLKALVIRCDTFGQNKTLRIEADGVPTATILTVNATGPQVVMRAFAPIEGRVFRVLPTDTNPGRVWEIEPIFDEEPLQLDRWETQRIDHGVVGWHMLLRGFVTVRSTQDVTLTLTSYNQTGGVVQTQVYILPSTSGEKRKLWVPFQSAKAVLYQWLFTSAAAFFLYREESSIIVQVWGGGSEQPIRPFGTDDMDHVRERTHGPAYPEIPRTPVLKPIE